MILIDPSVEYLPNKDNIAQVAACARICYNSNTRDDQKLFDTLIKRGHTSMLRHGTLYTTDPTPDSVYIYKTVVAGVEWSAVNLQFLHDHPEVSCLWVPVEQVPFEAQRFTFILTTQISTTRELNRVSPNGIAERSTRYVNYNKTGQVTFVKPHWYDGGDPKVRTAYIESLKSAEESYRELLQSLPPGDARGVLPLDVISVVAYTYGYGEWQSIIAKRVHHTTGKAHQNAVLVCSVVEGILEKLKNS